MTVAKAKPTKAKSTRAKPSKTAPRSSGRPTKEQAGRITDHIVEVARELFLASSFDAISVDLIAATARISKQTFYARFASKEELYAAMIRKSTIELLMPAVADSNRDGPLETTLVKLGFELSKRALAPAATALERLVMFEAQQFPELALAYHENGAHVRKQIAGIFANAMRDGQIRSGDAVFIAEQFVSGVADGPVRAMVLSGNIVKSDKDLRERVTAAVRLFLDGCRDSSV